MDARHRVLPAVRGYEVYDEQTGRTLSLHERLDDDHVTLDEMS